MARLLNNLGDYFTTAKSVIESEKLQIPDNRSKMFFVNKKYSHHEEVSERLGFLEFYAAETNLKIRSEELKLIYGLFSQSLIPSDIVMFYAWIKKILISQKADSIILE